jgi:hypothetical protein
MEETDLDYGSGVIRDYANITVKITNFHLY